MSDTKSLQFVLLFEIMFYQQASFDGKLVVEIDIKINCTLGVHFTLSIVRLVIMRQNLHHFVFVPET